MISLLLILKKYSPGLDSFKKPGKTHVEVQIPLRLRITLATLIFHGLIIKLFL